MSAKPATTGGDDFGIPEATHREPIVWFDPGRRAASRAFKECKSRSNIGPQKRSDYLIVAE